MPKASPRAPGPGKARPRHRPESMPATASPQPHQDAAGQHRHARTPAHQPPRPQATGHGPREPSSTEPVGARIRSGWADSPGESRPAGTSARATTHPRPSPHERSRNRKPPMSSKPPITNSATQPLPMSSRRPESRSRARSPDHAEASRPGAASHTPTEQRQGIKHPPDSSGGTRSPPPGKRKAPQTQKGPRRVGVGALP